MPSSVERFLTELAESGLVSQDTIRFVIDGAVGQTGSGEELAARLVQEGRLTQYQADSLLMGNGRTLVLGNYTILDAIGAGGMGVVLKAEHRRMKRKVALKILPQSATDSDESVKRFCREVQAAAKLNHPNIITTYDADEAKGVHFYIMEYVDGCDLARLVEERGPLPVGVAVSCILQSARGLAYAHSEGIVHRDIKPSNLMLDYSGTVQILDMGLARLQDCDTEGSSDLTGAGVILGTIDYMSPEQALDTQHADHRADVYSLGATLHYLITGQAMLAGKTRGQKMQTLLSTSQTQTATLLCRRDDVPTELEEIFQRMTARSLESRYQSMDEVVTALTQFASDHASVSSAQAFDFKAVATRTPTAQAGLSSSALERLIEDRSVATTLVQPHGVEFSEQTAPDLPGVTSGISPRVPSTVLGQYQTRRFPWTLLVASSLFLAAFAGGTALLLQARAGTLHITIPDGLAGPVTVDLDGESKKIRGRDDNVVTVDVAAGTHDRLRVMVAPDCSQMPTKALSLMRVTRSASWPDSPPRSMEGTAVSTRSLRQVHKRSHRISHCSSTASTISSNSPSSSCPQRCR